MYCRTLINQGNEVYIVCKSYGAGGAGGAGSVDYQTTLDAGRVTVSNRC